MCKSNQKKAHLKRLLESEPDLIYFIKLRYNLPNVQKYFIIFLDNIVLPVTRHIELYLSNMVHTSDINGRHKFKYNIWDCFIWYPMFDLIMFCRISSFIWTPNCWIASRIDFMTFTLIDTILVYIHQLYVPQWVRRNSGSGEHWTSEGSVKSNSLLAKCVLFVTFSLIGLVAMGSSLYFWNQTRNYLSYVLNQMIESLMLFLH